MPVTPSNNVLEYGSFEDFCSFMESTPVTHESFLEGYIKYLAYKYALPCSGALFSLEGDYTVLITGAEQETYRMPRWAWFVHASVTSRTVKPGSVMDHTGMREICLLCNIAFRPGARNEDMPTQIIPEDYFLSVQEPIAETFAEMKQYTPEQILKGVMGLDDGLGEPTEKDKASA